jgi:hypothetical protein
MKNSGIRDVGLYLCGLDAASVSPIAGIHGKYAKFIQCLERSIRKAVGSYIKFEDSSSCVTVPVNVESSIYLLRRYHRTCRVFVSQKTTYHMRDLRLYFCVYWLNPVPEKLRFDGRMYPCEWMIT